MRNLMISLTMLTVQIALSFALILAMRSQHWPIDYQAAGPAVALMVSVTITSLIKALVLKRVLKAPVSGYRWPLVWAALAAILVGTIFTSLPKSMEWAETGRSDARRGGKGGGGQGR